MLDNILNLVKDQVLPVVQNNNEIPEDKKNDVIETTASSFMDGLKDQLIPSGGITDMIGGLLGGGKSNDSNPLSNFGNSVMVSGIQSTVASALSSKVGLNSSLSKTIASAVVPMVFNMMKSKSNDSNSGFDLTSLIGMLAGGSNDKKGDSGLLGKLGGLFN